jgi:hypothetical protein
MSSALWKENAMVGSLRKTFLYAGREMEMKGLEMSAIHRTLRKFHPFLFPTDEAAWAFLDEAKRDHLVRGSSVSRKRQRFERWTLASPITPEERSHFRNRNGFMSFEAFQKSREMKRPHPESNVGDSTNAIFALGKRSELAATATLEHDVGSSTLPHQNLAPDDPEISADGSFRSGIDESTWRSPRDEMLSDDLERRKDGLFVNIVSQKMDHTDKGDGVLTNKPALEHNQVSKTPLRDIAGLATTVLDNPELLVAGYVRWGTDESPWKQPQSSPSDEALLADMERQSKQRRIGEIQSPGPLDETQPSTLRRILEGAESRSSPKPTLSDFYELSSSRIVSRIRPDNDSEAPELNQGAVSFNDRGDIGERNRKDALRKVFLYEGKSAELIGLKKSLIHNRLRRFHLPLFPNDETARIFLERVSNDLLVRGKSPSAKQKKFKYWKLSSPLTPEEKLWPGKKGLLNPSSATSPSPISHGLAGFTSPRSRGPEHNDTSAWCRHANQELRSSSQLMNARDCRWPAARSGSMEPAISETVSADPSIHNPSTDQHGCPQDGDQGANYDEPGSVDNACFGGNVGLTSQARQSPPSSGRGPVPDYPERLVTLSSSLGRAESSLKQPQSSLKNETMVFEKRPTQERVLGCIEPPYPQKPTLSNSSETPWAARSDTDAGVPSASDNPLLNRDPDDGTVQRPESMPGDESLRGDVELRDCRPSFLSGLSEPSISEISAAHPSIDKGSSVQGFVSPDSPDPSYDDDDDDEVYVSGESPWIEDDESPPEQLHPSQRDLSPSGDNAAGSHCNSEKTATVEKYEGNVFTTQPWAGIADLPRVNSEDGSRTEEFERSGSGVKSDGNKCEMPREQCEDASMEDVNEWSPSIEPSWLGNDKASPGHLQRTSVLDDRPIGDSGEASTLAMEMPESDVSNWRSIEWLLLEELNESLERLQRRQSLKATCGLPLLTKTVRFSSSEMVIPIKRHQGVDGLTFNELKSWIVANHAKANYRELLQELATGVPTKSIQDSLAQSMERLNASPSVERKVTHFDSDYLVQTTFADFRNVLIGDLTWNESQQSTVAQVRERLRSICKSGSAERANEAKIKDRMLKVYSMLPHALTSARALSSWIKYEIRVNGMDQMTVPRRASAVALFPRFGTFSDLGELTPMPTAPVSSESVFFHRKPYAIHHNPRVAAERVFSVQCCLNSISDLPVPSIDVGQVQITMPELEEACRNNGADWSMLVKDVRGSAALGSPRLLLSVRRLQLDRDSYQKKHQREVKRLGDTLEEIQKLNLLLRHSEYPRSLQFPIDWADQDGWTLLHCAVKLRCPRTVKSLLNAGARPQGGPAADGLAHRSTATGKVASPLFMAKNMLRSIEEQSNRPGRHELYNFQRKGMEEIVHLLKEYGEDMPPTC